jgi:hypothetical protein
MKQVTSKALAQQPHLLQELPNQHSILIPDKRDTYSIHVKVSQTAPIYVQAEGLIHPCSMRLG